METEKNNLTGKSPRWVYIAALLIGTVFYRLIASQVDWLGNTSPLMAIAFGGGMLLGRRFWWAPALMLIVSDIALAQMNGWGFGKYMLFTVPFYAVIALLGATFFKNHKWSKMLLGTLAASVVFYLLANTFAWATSPAYAHNFAGWWQSQTSGLPGFPPSWTFLRNALIADSIWCLVATPLFFTKSLTLQNVSGFPVGSITES